MKAPRTWLINLWCAAALSVATVALPAPAFAEPASAESAANRLPPRFHVAESMRPRFGELLERSATFRAQCRRISDAEVRVVFEVGHALAVRFADSRALPGHPRRGRPGAVRSRAGQPGRHAHELLPHELEHVIEQLEGLDLAAVANKRNGTVWRVTGHDYETSRADQVAERVLARIPRVAKGRPRLERRGDGMEREWAVVSGQLITQDAKLKLTTHNFKIHAIRSTTVRIAEWSSWPSPRSTSDASISRTCEAKGNRSPRLAASSDTIRRSFR